MRTFVRCRRKLNNNILNVSIIARETKIIQELESEKEKRKKKVKILKNIQKEETTINGRDIFIRLVRDERRIPT